MTLTDTSAAMSLSLPEGVPTFDGTQTGGPVLLTPSQAAAVLGKSERTVLRRMDVPGKLPDGWTVTERGGKKLVRVADVRTLPGQSAVTVAAGEASVTGGAGSPPTGKAAADTSGDTLRAEIAALRAQLEASAATIAGLVSTVQELRAQVASASEREAWLRAQVEQAAAERKRVLDLVPKALPPGRPWWARILNRGTGERQDG